MATAADKLILPAPKLGRKYVWQLPVRVTHWVNGLAIFVLFFTGLFIASPVLTPQGEAYRHFWMGRWRELHLLFGFILMLASVTRVYWFFTGNNYARSGFP